MTAYTASSGQTLTNTQIGPNDSLIVSPGGEAVDTFAASTPEPENGRELGAYGQIYSGVGGTIVNGGVLLNTALNSSSEEITASGVSNSTTVGSLNAFNTFIDFFSNGLTASSEQVDNGGTTNNTVVIFGTQTVMSGGTANDAVISGASMGYASPGTVLGGGVQNVLSGGVSNGTTLNGGTITIAAGGATAGTTVNYGVESVSGSASKTTILAAGSQVVAAGGIASSTIVDGVASTTPKQPGLATSAPAGLAVLSGGEVFNALVENGGTLSDGGRISGTTVQGASSQLVVAAGAFADNTNLRNGGLENVVGSEAFAIIGGNGTITVQSGGIITTPTIQAGGCLDVLAGGLLDTGSTRSVSNAGSITNAGTIQIEPSLGLFYPSSYLSVLSGGSLSNSGVINIPVGPSVNGSAAASGGSLVLQAGSSATNTGTINVGSANAQPGSAPATAAHGNLDVQQGATLTNGGLLAGPVSVEGTLALTASQMVSGEVVGSATSLLELTGSGGTLTDLGNSDAGYFGFNTVQLDPGASWTLGGGDTLAAGSVLYLGAGSTLSVGNGGVAASSAGTIAFQGISTLDVSLQGQTTGAGISNFNVASVINALDAQAGDTVFALGSNDAIINLADSGSPFLLRFLGDSGRHLQLRESTGLMGTLTLEPVATALVAHPATSGTLIAGSVITFDLTPETAVAVDTTFGLPTMGLSDGGTATFDQVASTSTNLVFRTTVAGGQASSDLKVTGLSLAGSTITDAIGTSLDTSSVATLAGSDTGIVISAPSSTPPAPPTTVTGGVTVIGGAGGTVFITPKAGSNTVTATATGNDTVISQGTDTIQAGGGADVVYATGTAAIVAGSIGSLTFEGGSGNYMVVGGSGSNAIYGGSGSDTFFGGTGLSMLVASSGANNLLLAGVGNATLVGGLGKAVMMFGGPGTDSFVGSGGGGDIMVGGAGGNSFSLTNGDVAFGGPIKADTFTAGNGAAMITTGSGGAQVNLGSGTLNAFEGSGAVNYNAGKGEGGTTDIVGFTVHDHITLTGGFSAQDASTAFNTAIKGGFGTTLNLTDGTKINIFGVNLAASQISAG